MNKELNQQIFMDNLHQKKLKEAELAREKEADKRMVDQIVERERLLGILEAQEKERHKKETRDYLKNFKNRSNELQTDQDYLDKLLEEEKEKQWKKQKDQWDREERARVNLLHDVYNDRARALEHKKALREEDARQKMLERQEVQGRLNAYNKQVTKDKLNETLVSDSTHTDEF